MIYVDNLKVLKWLLHQVHSLPEDGVDAIIGLIVGGNRVVNALNRKNVTSVIGDCEKVLNLQFIFCKKFSEVNFYLLL